MHVLCSNKMTPKLLNHNGQAPVFLKSQMNMPQIIKHTSPYPLILNKHTLRYLFKMKKKCIALKHVTVLNIFFNKFNGAMNVF